jgi:hypothetical protein
VFSNSVYLFPFIAYSYVRKHVPVAIMVMVTGGIQILVYVVS